MKRLRFKIDFFMKCSGANMHELVSSSSFFGEEHAPSAPMSCVYCFVSFYSRNHLCFLYSWFHPRLSWIPGRRENRCFLDSSFLKMLICCQLSPLRIDKNEDCMRVPTSFTFSDTKDIIFDRACLRFSAHRFANYLMFEGENQLTWIPWLFVAKFAPARELVSVDAVY